MNRRYGRAQARVGGDGGTGIRLARLALGTHWRTPHASEIVMLLDSHGFTFPAAPAFEDLGTDLVCYSVIHHAWREGLLPAFLAILQIWRGEDGRLCDAGRSTEFQEGLLEFLRDHRGAGLSALCRCFGQQSPCHGAPSDDPVCVQAVRRRLDRIWNDYFGRCAA